MDVIKQLKQELIKELAKHDAMIALAAFFMELDSDLEMANWLAQEFAHTYEQHIQLHMKQALEAQLKLNASTHVIAQVVNAHIKQLGEADLAAHGTQAQQATKHLLDKFMLH